MQIMEDSTFSFQDNKELYELTYCKVIGNLQFKDTRDGSKCIHLVWECKDEMNVVLALRKPIVHRGDCYTHFIKGSDKNQKRSRC